jgi:hypothetical protein
LRTVVGQDEEVIQIKFRSDEARERFNDRKGDKQTKGSTNNDYKESKRTKENINNVEENEKNYKDEEERRRLIMSASNQNGKSLGKERFTSLMDPNSC